MVLAAVGVAAARAATSPAEAARACRPPTGAGVVGCRFGVHGTPDESRAAWRSRTGAEVSVSVRVDGLAANPAAGGAPSWPVVDSLGQPMGRLSHDPATGRFALDALDGRRFGASSVRVRGRGCAASTVQQRRFTLVQIHAAASASHGTQGFLDTRALDASSPSGRAAREAFSRQRGTGCGPSGRVVGRWRALTDPRVGGVAHARLSNGALNSVDEYDAKPDFGHVVCFMTNTTSVRVGGIARGMVRVGTPVAKVDRIAGCDANSDGTLTWRYLAIATGMGPRPQIYGWLPARCPGSRAGESADLRYARPVGRLLTAPREPPPADAP